ncbi:MULTISPECIES: RsmD family RNA methyltransferase [Myroides]|uniref:16S rRNA (Guanine(966)-N(2))-methyltransferase RsmD n=3 Tax=Myroides odoratimimus TaxID=76832 RepID=A0A0S7EE35_9FLAO|nr:MULTISPECIES: RsmD family RNA methyltransferase [Myroides]ALU27617.1 16S rRNA (guanine(966)-N(2))-methyltransferase RsmD [Myroides odoratimimus]APA94007.1 16S rRNA (guanine(966)-N(2))-methyltransferase RsmD [Myroides sp. ZB35]EHO07482.1 RsmD family RNA methyltransferase [Myroides odoratimimus CCUG 12901]EHO08870.1 RsmD family RNA methyltransferase [Myroides odoratimimus CIP 101113]EHO09720.1 RsmD family RNA methyltransferase [Myroides odoratimimus CCUG 10230]
MRIISGKLKGRRISPPKNLPVRPTTDMSKESLFNILNNHFNFSELTILDLFAGTGNISYEFASRGAESIVSVDGDMGCVNFIKKTAKELDLNIIPLKSDVFKFIEKHQASYDIVFADPPYDFTQEQFEKILKDIFEKGLVDEQGMVVIEHSKFTKMDHLEHFSFEKNYGGSVFTFFEYELEDEDEEDDDE